MVAALSANHPILALRKFHLGAFSGKCDFKNSSAKVKCTRPPEFPKTGRRGRKFTPVFFLLDSSFEVANFPGSSVFRCVLYGIAGPQINLKIKILRPAAFDLWPFPPCGLSTPFPDSVFVGAVFWLRWPSFFDLRPLAPWGSIGPRFPASGILVGAVLRSRQPLNFST